MIAKKIANPRKSAPKAVRIRLLADYVRNPETESATEKCVYAGARGFLTNTPAAQTAEMIALAEGAVRSRDPITHFVFSWALGEHPTNQQVEECVDILEDEMELRGHQIIYGLHVDTKNSHLHVVVNRVIDDEETGHYRVHEINRGFDIEAVHRVGARIEAAQGWSVEANKRYRVREDGSLERTVVSKERPQSPGQRELDAERRTGTKSASRIAIEQAAPVIANACSWAELHDGLAAIGMRYEKKGSGAVVLVNSIPVKASRVARPAALKQLEKRLGVFVAPQDAQRGPGTAPAQHAKSGASDPAEAVPLIQAASGWAELHASLAEHGMRYEKVGGGAAITVGETRHKASSVARRVMLKHLEERIGIFVTPQNAQQDADPTDAVPLIQTASSWAQLHASLAEHGMRYEKVGSGAAITVGRTRHKASSVARQVMLKHLEERIGIFVAPQNAQQDADPTDAVPLIQAASSWAELHASLAEHGMRYEKVGGGAAITVGETRHKASSVARQVMLKHLEERIGIFGTPQNAQQVADPTDAVPLIQTASSWAELHASLAEHGMRYEKVGSGAAITVGGTRHKASSVARQVMLKHLEERIGIFVAPQNAQQDADPTDAVPLIQAASSWSELHASLAEHGMRYEKVGSGAAITVGGTRHKASSVARRASLGELQKRLGRFRPAMASPDKQLPDREAEPLDGNAKSWQVYRGTREAHNAARDAARLALDREWDRRFEELRQRKNADRDALTRHSWKGRGTELNAMRSALAHEHAAQIARLRQERRAALRQIRREYPPWPSYDEWLSDVERWWREQTRARLFLQAQGKAVTSGPLRPVHGYTPELIGSRVHYAKPPRTKAAFVDLGRSIAMCGQKHDDDDLLAAMILAARKWGEFVASADRNFFEASIRLAALHDLPLANPELQDDLERERARHGPQPEPDVPKRPHPTPAATAPKTSHSSI